jgi:plastocyanin
MRLHLSVAAILVLAVSAADAQETATIKLFQFQPKEITVKVGSEVTWTNGDDIEHSVTAGKPGQETGAFDSGFFAKAGTFSQTFDKAGTFEFFCKRHPSMKGKITVTP